MYLSRQRFVFLRISTFSKAGTYLTNSKKLEAFVTFPKSWKLSLLFQKAGSFCYFFQKLEAFVTLGGIKKPEWATPAFYP
jgi:hypothetical protein